MTETFDYIRTFAQFPFALRRFRRHSLTLEGARQILQERHARRTENFLEMVERSIYGYPSSPYLPLLKRAGCELGDVQALVKRKGLEGALRKLREEGVYVDFEEFKGRKPITRNGLTIPVQARDFDNPFARRDFTLKTGGSTGTAVNVGVDLDYIVACAPHEMITYAAHGLLDAPMIRWTGILPSGSIRNILRTEAIGRPLLKWFSPLGWHSSKQWLKYVLATYYCVACMRLSGLAVPFPQFVPPARALEIAQNAAGLLKSHGQCLVRTHISSALRVCVAAEAAGLDLSGTVFMGGAEPVTPAKIERIQQAGRRYVPLYGLIESSIMGVGCADPIEVGDYHFFTDAFALFTYPYVVERFGMTVPAFNLTAFLPAAPKIMLNFQMDDYGIVEQRHCGCALETYGYSTHLREIRSYSKLTGEGVTLIGNEVAQIIEQGLPARFGGSPLDYQLLEEEDGQGFTRLYLLISPRVGIIDEQVAVQFVLDSLANSSAMADAARTVLEGTQTLQVRRRDPILTERGKLLPLYIQRRSQSARVTGEEAR